MNEDYWQEFMDIDLGNWAKLSLRDIAIAGGVKEVYDAHYDLLSAFVHGNWLAMKSVVFDNCLNPLHRFHRVPVAPKIGMGLVVRDMSRLINRMLDDLSNMYPPLKARLTWHNRNSATETDVAK